jgi:hypothetical protein
VRVPTFSVDQSRLTEHAAIMESVGFLEFQNTVLV